MPQINAIRRQITGINGMVDAIVTRGRHKIYVQNITAIYFRNDDTITVRTKSGRTIRGASWITGVSPAIDPALRPSIIPPADIERVITAVRDDLQAW